jgi:hypothetical protein
MSFPMSSCNCQAICIHRGQLSVSEMGAPHFLGNPVVSVSNIKYISPSPALPEREGAKTFMVLAVHLTGYKHFKINCKFKK